jgi:uncharacterized membrane protein YphA (DoxX/SURF4 family)
MNNKTKNIINWVLAGIVAFIFIGSAIGKLTADQEGLKQAANFGLDKSSYAFLGIIEIVAVILFLIPRTSIIGTLLLVAYMGGAIATHLEHAQPLAPPVIVSILVWIVAFVRNPELSNRVLAKSQS